MRRAKYAKVVCEASFHELTKEEIWNMRRRDNFRVDINRFLEHYGITAKEYCARIKELGFAVIRDERAAWQKERSAEPTPVKEDILTKYEMRAVRMFRGYNRLQFSKVIQIHERKLKEYESYHAPLLIQKKYIEILKITNSELQRIRNVLSGKTKKLEIDREIPLIVKTQVRKRDKNKCVKCGTSGRLHFHHKKRFSDGGLHTADNLILLCPDCHAEEHIGERCYALIKSHA